MFNLRLMSEWCKFSFTIKLTIICYIFVFTVGTVVDGDITMNGQHVDDTMQQESGFMHQDDLFVDNLTVIEHLTIMVSITY